MPTATSADTTAYLDISARAVGAAFNTRPTLRSATARLLQSSLQEQYPSLDFDPERTRLAQPLAEGGWTLTLLIDVVLNYLASGTAPLLVEQFGRQCFLTNKAPVRLSVDSAQRREPDMQIIASIIAQLPATVHIGFQEDLSAYWNAVTDSGVSRWQWMADLLAGVLKTSAVRHASTNSLQAEILTKLCNNPDKQQRLDAPGSAGTIQACFIETTLSKDQLSVTLQSPDILLICGETRLLCNASGGIESFASLEAFGRAWCARFEPGLMAAAISWKRYEPDGNLFDIQAALLLNQQLDDLAALTLPVHTSLVDLEKRYATITDPAARFMGAQASTGTNLAHLPLIQETIPQWLQKAEATDRMAYRKQVLALASLKQQSAGRSFRTGIDDLHTFAKKALHQQMSEDRPSAPGYDADQLELTFHVPVGDLGSGYIHLSKMSLTQLAINNLASRPNGRMTVRHTTGQEVEDWVTESYLLGLVSRVNVGKQYPELIQTQLLGDTPQARERQRLFGLELAVHLPMLALEQAIKAEQGFTRQGYRYVEALMHSTKAERFVDEQEIVLRPLAFQRKAQAECDVASNMFIIEPRDLRADGPRILYRPLYVPALQQFPTRQALLGAVAQSGPLQSSVLTWLTDRARPVYANNGFNEPHIIHFHVGDDFVSPDKPKPAILAGNEAATDWIAALEHGRLLMQLFDSNARALVELADRQSVSNAESRWAIILEGGWLLFNNLLLPLARGPAMLVGWMLQITHSLIQDLPALDSDDAMSREQAWVDVLLNIGLLLLHAPLREARPDSISPNVAPEFAQVLTPLRRPTSPLFEITQPEITEATPGLPSEPPGSGNTLLDFNLSTARDSASARLFEKLKAVRVPWPATLPDPVATGPFKGLYRINDKWHATVAALFFRVSIVPGFGEVYLVHPEHPDHPGIKLKSDGLGKWTLDQGLKLVGGGGKKRIEAVREQRQQRIEELDQEFQTFLDQQDRMVRRVDIADNLAQLKLNSPSSTEQERSTFRQRYVQELDLQTQSYLTLINGIKEKSALTGRPVDEEMRSVLLGNIIKNERKRIVMADHDRQAANANSTEFSNVGRLYDALSGGDNGLLERYFDFVRTTSEINEVMIKSFEAVDNRLQELEQIPQLGNKTLEELNKDRPENELTALGIKIYQLTTLRILSVRTLMSDTTTALEAAIDPLVMLARSHAELQSAHVYESSDRIAVLDNLVDHYNKAQDALGSIEIFSTDELQRPAFNRLREIIEQLRVDAEQRLADELQRSSPAQTQPADGTNTHSSTQEPGTSKGTGSGKKSSTASRKKVIKTSKGALIGDIRPHTDNQGGEIVDIKGPMEDSPMTSFREDSPDVWVEMVAAKAPQPQATSRPYPQLKGDARNALVKVDEQVRKIEGYAERASSPREIEEQLQREAQKLMHFADKLESHEQAPTTGEKDAALLTELRAKAQVLERKATELRTRMTLDQAPTSEGLEYLQRHNQLYVRIIGARVQLKTGRKDFVQEYVVLNRENRPWWYGHFHYAKVDDAKANYTQAHLKTKAQRYETYESALAKATDPKQKIEIHHGLITQPLAEQSFLPLEPR
jgi:hypothetical protein